MEISMRRIFKIIFLWVYLCGMCVSVWLCVYAVGESQCWECLHKYKADAYVM